MRGKTHHKKPRECLLPGCGKKLSKQFHFCKEHEALVPPVLLDAVKRTRAAYDKHLDFNTVRNEMHRKQWQLARGVAIVAVQFRLGQITEGELAKAIGNQAPDAPPFNFAVDPPKEEGHGHSDTEPQSRRDDQDRA
jgi:hypothetical protein